MTSKSKQVPSLGDLKRRIAEGLVSRNYRVGNLEGERLDVAPDTNYPLSMSVLGPGRDDKEYIFARLLFGRMMNRGWGHVIMEIYGYDNSARMRDLAAQLSGETGMIVEFREYSECILVNNAPHAGKLRRFLRNMGEEILRDIAS